MTNSDDLFFLQEIQSPLDAIHKELRIIAILLREGLGIPDEDSSLTQKTPPTIIS